MTAPAAKAIGKWALVAGAASEVGRAVALMLSKSFDIVALDQNYDALNTLARQIGDRAKVIALAVDPAQPPRLEPALKELFQREGFEIGLLACCGAGEPDAPSSLLGASDVDRLLQRGLATPVELTRLLASKRLNRKALRHAVFVADAGAAGALEGFTRAAATELAPGTRVNCVKLAGADAADRAAATVQFLVSDDARWVTGQCINLGEQP